MDRQSGVVAGMVRLAVPGMSRGAPYTAPEPPELLAQCAALLLPAAGERLRAEEAAAESLARVAHEFHAAFAALDLVRAVPVLNGLMDSYGAMPYLTDDVGQPFHLHFHGRSGGVVHALAGEFAAALALTVDTYGEQRFGLCEASGCDRAYVDLTRNGSRRYCSTQCSSRARMSAYRGRLKSR